MAKGLKFRLHLAIQAFLVGKEDVKLSEIIDHILELGFNLADREMLTEWLQSEFPNAGILYDE